MSKWQMIPLNRIAAPIARPITVEAGKGYRTIGVKWWGEGAYERQTVDGSQTAAKTLSVVREGDLIINKIWVRHGSTAIATKDVDGCAASNEFPTFQLDIGQVHPRWIHWLTKTKWFWTQCDHLSMGTSGKNRIKPERFLTIQIPLPPLPEQRRLVERIDALAEKLDEAGRLRASSRKATAALEERLITRFLASSSFPSVSMEELAGRANLKNGKSLRLTAQPTQVRCLTLAALRKGVIDTNSSKPIAMDLPEAAPYLVSVGDIFVVRGNGSKDLVGRAGIVTEVSGYVIFPDLFIRVPLPPDRIDPEYFVEVWNSRLVRTRIEDQARTTSGIWKVNQGHIASTSIPVPALEVQRSILRRVIEARTTVSVLEMTQAETEEELRAMMPAILYRTFGAGH